MPLVALAALPHVADGRHGVVVMAHQVVLAQEEVELVRTQRAPVLQVQVDGMEGDVQVGAPVVDLGDVRLDQRVVHRQGVEAESLGQDRLAHLGRLALEVDPQQALRIREGRREFLEAQVGAQLARSVSMEYADHRLTPSAEQMALRIPSPPRPHNPGLPTAIIRPHGRPRDREPAHRPRRQRGHGRDGALQPDRPGGYRPDLGRLRHPIRARFLLRRQPPDRDPLQPDGRGRAGLGLRADLHRLPGPRRPLRRVAPGLLHWQPDSDRAGQRGAAGGHLRARPGAVRPGARLQGSSADPAHRPAAARHAHLARALRPQRPADGDPQCPAAFRPPGAGAGLLPPRADSRPGVPRPALGHPGPGLGRGVGLAPAPGRPAPGPGALPAALPPDAGTGRRRHAPGRRADAAAPAGRGRRAAQLPGQHHPGLRHAGGQPGGHHAGLRSDDHAAGGAGAVDGHCRPADLLGPGGARRTGRLPHGRGRHAARPGFPLAAGQPGPDPAAGAAGGAAPAARCLHGRIDAARRLGAAVVCRRAGGPFAARDRRPGFLCAAGYAHAGAHRRRRHGAERGPQPDVRRLVPAPGLDAARRPGAGQLAGDGPRMRPAAPAAGEAHGGDWRGLGCVLGCWRPSARERRWRWVSCSGCS